MSRLRCAGIRSSKLGPITSEELASIQPQRDADSHPHNPELNATLAELAGGTTPIRITEAG